MKRREFIELCAALSAGIPLVGSATGCTDSEIGRYQNLAVNFSGRVIVVGAGAAGLAAGYLLDRYGIDFQIFEASSVFGGRLKRSADFTDFPVDLGAEWIHDRPASLAELVDDPNIDTAIDLVRYAPDSASVYSGGRLRSANWATNYYGEYKFKRTTWYGFVEEFFAPSVAGRITYNRPVVSVDSTGNRIAVTDTDGTVEEADRVIMAVPTKILKDRRIVFTPPLPDNKVNALEGVTIPPGIKVFMEFSERFYPDITVVGNALQQEKLYYDAAFRKDTDRNVLALFWVSEDAHVYTDIDADDDIVEVVLDELDEIFDGRARPAFLQAVVQNWAREPWIAGAYVTASRNSDDETVEALKAPIDGRVFFSGSAMHADNISTVHGAVISSFSAVERLLANRG